MIFLADVALIISISCLTGIAYHLAAYGEHGPVSRLFAGSRAAGLLSAQRTS